MLQICTREKIDIFQVSKMLVKYDVNVRIFDQAIILDGNISDELLITLQHNLKIVSIQNYISDSDNSNVIEKEDKLSITHDSNKKEKIHHQKQLLAPQIIKSYNLKYSHVKHGEVYWCDFGEPYSHEIGYMRPAVILKKLDYLGWPLTIVAPISGQEVNSPFVIKLNCSDKITYNSDNHTLSKEYGFIEAEQIRAIDKTRLRNFIGTVSSSTLREIKKPLIELLDLIEDELKAVISKNVKQQYTNISINQIQLINMVDIPKLIDIAKANFTNKVKAENFLKLFGFDMDTQEVQYIFQAILIASKKEYYTLDMLCELIAKDSNLSKNEIERVINSTVKKQFKFKHSLAIDFIRLVNNFLA